jgi:hypothetical protein
VAELRQAAVGQAALEARLAALQQRAAAAR